MSKNNDRDLDMATRKEFAGQIKALRQKAGMKQEELASYSGLSRQTISNIERGGTIPQLDNLQKIYEVLGVDLEPASFSGDTEVWLGIIGALLDKLQQPTLDLAGRAAMNAVTDVMTSNVGATRDTSELKQEDYDLVAHPYTEETGELMDE